MPDTLRVLYVDDEPDLLEIGKVFLEDSGDFTVTVTMSASDAIRLLGNQKFDAIISDYQMPGMDGIQLLVEVRTRFGPIPFILFTGKGREEIVIQAINNGADFYLQKGGEPEAQFAELSHKIKKAVEGQRAEEADRVSRDRLIRSEANLTTHQAELKAQADELMRAKLALEESRDKYLDLYDFAPLGYLTLSEKALITNLNLTGAKLLGVERSSLARAPFRKFVAEKDADEWHWYFLNLLNQEEQRSCKLIIRRRDGSAFPARLEGIRITGSDGTNTVRIAFTDISDITQAEEILRESEEKFRSLAESSPDYIMRYDRQCRHTYMNPAALRVFGLTEGQIIGKRHREIGFDETQSGFYEEIITGVFEKGKPFQTQFTWERAGGRVFLDLMLTPEFSDKGTVQSVLGVSRDITRLKNAEEAIKQNEVFLKRTGEIARVGGWEMDAETLVVTWTEETYHIHEVPMGQIPPLEEAIHFFHPDDQAKLTDAITHALTTGEGYDMELRFITATGKHLWTRTVCQPKVVDGKTIRLDGIFQDITDRKQAEEELLRKNEELNASYEEIAASQEELRNNLDALTRQEQALQESKQELADIIEFLPDATFVIDREGVVIAWNRAMEEMTGISKTAMIGKGDHEYTIPFYGERRRQLLDLIDADDEELQAKYQNIKREGKTLNAEVFTPALYGGKGAYVWATGSPLFDNRGNRIGSIESIRDITSWKRAELELVSAHDRLKEAHQLAHIGTWDWVVESDTVIWSEELYNISGWDPSLTAPTYAELPRIYTPASWERLSAAVTNALNTGEPYNLELELIRPDGSIRWTHAFGGVIRDVNGKVTGLHGTVQDITESKQAQDASRESEARLRAILDATPFPIALVDISDNNIEFWSRSALTLFGHTAPSAPEWYQIAYPDPDYRADVIARWKPYLEKAKISGETVNTGEYRVTCRDGSVRICELYASFLPDKLIVTFNDITERQQVEEALRESEETFKALAENANDGILVAVNDGAHTYANRRVCEMLGYSVAELQKSSIKDIAVPDEVAKLQERFRKRLLGEDIPQQYETSLLHKDRTIVPVEISAAKTFWQGQPADLVIVHDITERRRVEETIQHAFAERGVLLREIHHRVRNNLASIISLIGLQVASLTDPTTISLLRDLQTRIQSMALVHESLYISEDLARINFGNYTEKLARHLFDIYVTGDKIQCRIEMGDVTMPIETAIPCGLVITEIITNSLKYAFPKTFSCKEIRGEFCSITLTLRREESNYILNIADNGIGMKDGTDVTVTRSLGLYLIKLIVQYQLRGSLEICTDKGTSYTIRFPDPVVKG